MCVFQILIIVTTIKVAGTANINRIDVPVGHSATTTIPRYPPVVDGTLYTETWTWIPNHCNETATGYVCLESAHCFTDLILGVSCMRYADEIVLRTDKFIVDAGSIKQIESLSLNGVPNIFLSTKASNKLEILNASLQNAGIYIRYSRNGTRTAKLDVVVVGVLGQARDRLPQMSSPVISSHAYIKLSLKNFKALVYHVGDTINVSTAVILGPSPEIFTLEFRVLFLRYNPTCKFVTIYEPCIFHPKEPECITTAEQSVCHFASNIDILQLAAARSENCSTGYRRCIYDTAIDESVQARLTFIEPGIPSFKMKDVQVDDAGLYVVVALYNGRPSAWTYIYLSTVETYLNVYENYHKPGFGYKSFLQNSSIVDENEASDWSSSSIKRRNNGTILYDILLTSLSIGAIIIVIVGGVCIAILIRRRRRRRTRGLFGEYPKYMTLPGNDLGGMNVPYGNACSGNQVEYYQEKSDKMKRMGSGYTAWLKNDMPKIRKRLDLYH
uniref:Envelope glycoprotein E n=1 Tax=Gallid alphaherpesvirus 2 TaxID=10390 RepID=U6CJK3_9ALPH|nr:Glycoprotein E [Gallid alphaherpesvirus 2]